MNYSRKKIKQNAKVARKLYGMQVVGIFLLSMLVSSIGGGVIGGIIGIPGSLIPILNILIPFAVMFWSQPIMVGMMSYTLKKSRHEEVNAKEIFAFFKGRKWLNITITMMMTCLFTVLWSLLFIIPGIIKVFSYAMVPYILAENPDMKWKDVINASKQMMKGNKWHLFVLYLSFIGWYILGSFTFGILTLFFVMPYMSLAVAVFYTYVSTGTIVDYTLTASPTVETMQ